MDGWGIGIAVISLILYFASNKKAIFLFTAGVGVGLLAGAIWAAAIITSAIG